MPILQSRVLRLIEAAEAYRDRYQILFNSVLKLIGRVNEGDITAAHALTQITLELEHLKSYHPADKIIVEERMRYQFTYRRNIKERRKLIARRGKLQRINQDAPPTMSPARMNELLSQIDETDNNPDDITSITTNAQSPKPKEDYSTPGEMTPELEEFLKNRPKSS